MLFVHWAVVVIFIATVALTVGKCSFAAPALSVPTVPASASASAPITSIVWKKHTWKVTNGRMAGISPGSGRNVFIDANGYLHLKISHIGTVWTAAELFTSDILGFGTYQWQIEGAVDSLDPSTVLGLFPYGPTAGIGNDGENELDIEFSKWDNAAPTNADFTYYPPGGYGTKNSSGDAKASNEDDFSFSLAGKTLLTARTVWSSDSVLSTVMAGLQPLGTSSQVLHTHVYAPANPRTHIPQVPVPLGINFWSFRVHPARDQEVIIRDFQFIPRK